MTEIEKFKVRLDALEANPPAMNESPHILGYKILMIARLMLDMMQKQTRDGRL